MELFRQPNIDWLGKKWYFLGFSLIFSVAGVLSLLFWHGLPLGVDFRGGTHVTVAFASTPNEGDVRRALDAGGIYNFTVQKISGNPGQASNQEVIALPESTATDANHDAGRQAVENALRANYHDSGFEVLQVDIVGPTAGKQLQQQALWATMYSLVGMLMYLWFRFELI
jgi:preprotein translocase subunit SecF